MAESSIGRRAAATEAVPFVAAIEVASSQGWDIGEGGRACAGRFARQRGWEQSTRSP